MKQEQLLSFETYLCRNVTEKNLTVAPSSGRTYSRVCQNHDMNIFPTNRTAGFQNFKTRWKLKPHQRQRWIPRVFPCSSLGQRPGQPVLAASQPTLVSAGVTGRCRHGRALCSAGVEPKPSCPLGKRSTHWAPSCFFFLVKTITKN